MVQTVYYGYYATLDTTAPRKGQAGHVAHITVMDEGATMRLSDEAGSMGSGGMGVSPVNYTAFGERWRWDGQTGHVGEELPAGFPRYGYAGGYGYETGGFDGQSGILTLYGANSDLPPITLMHVGERWYQPGIGRFVQRDPIGIRGGLNTYAYCRNGPLAAVDPTGTRNDWGLGDLPRDDRPKPSPDDHSGDLAMSCLYLFLTGGEDSWLDNPVTVGRASRFCGKVSLICISGASGGIVGPWIGIGLGVGGALVYY